MINGVGNYDQGPYEYNKYNLKVLGPLWAKKLGYTIKIPKATPYEPPTEDPDGGVDSRVS